MDERARRQVDSRLVGTDALPLRAGPGDPLAAERVRAIEHDQLDPRLGRRLEAEQHRARVGVEADAGVLQIDHQRVEAGEILRATASSRRRRG